MTEIHFNLNNINDAKMLLSIFPASDKYEFTSKKVFRLKDRITCSCGCRMVHNGYNHARKKGFGKIRLGKQLCKKCMSQHKEDKQWWKELLSKWYDTVKSLLLVLRDSDVAWAAIAKIMEHILPISKDTARSLFNQRVEQFDYEQENYVIVNYDEQHPKKGRAQKFRLTLLNYNTKTVIAEDLRDSKDEKVIEEFLRANLDTNKPLIVIVDCDRRYPKIFKKIWGNRLVLQKCLLHLNKLIVKDFGRNITLLNEYNKYCMLNIFYNRSKELRFLEKLLKKQAKKNFACAKDKSDWVKKVRQKFREYVKELENERRRKGKKLTQRKLFKAKQVFAELWQQMALLPKKTQERLKMIANNWKFFTTFYSIKGCPATNNAIENYYSTSLKTHRKKQLRTDKGLFNHMKLAAIKRKEGFPKPKKTLLEIYGLFKLICN